MKEDEMGQAGLSGLSELLTVGQAAGVKGMTPVGVYKAIQSGRVPHIRVVGRIMLRAADVQSWDPAQDRSRGKRRAVMARWEGKRKADRQVIEKKE